MISLLNLGLTHNTRNVVRVELLISQVQIQEEIRKLVIKAVQ